MRAIKGLEFRKPLKTSPILEKTLLRFRSKVAAIAQDRFLATDIKIASEMIRDGFFVKDLKLPDYSGDE